MSTTQAGELIDLKGLSCPLLKTKKALQATEPGRMLQVEVTDAGSKSDLPALLKRSGDELLGVGAYTFS